jgi:hypothetical protein
MPSEADFLNDALGQIGSGRLTSIDDGSISANYCKTFWPALRRSLLRGHFWNFAEARAELAQDTVGPAFEYTFAYALPTLLLRIKVYNGANLTTTTFDGWWVTQWYKIEGRKLLTNDGSVKIVYVQDVTDPNLWDALFYQGAAAHLAAKLASAIAKDPRLAAAKLQEATALWMPLAVAVDGQENPEPPYQVPDLLWGR